MKAYQAQALELLKPGEDLTVSQFAEKYRVLEERSNSTGGPWRNDKTPYLVEIMDSACDPEIEETIFCKGTQMGATEALLNILGWVAAIEPGPALLVYPSDVLADSVVKNRFLPMVESCQPLAERYRQKSSKKNEIQFDGMYLRIVGSNSPSQLASMPARYLFMDEIDKFPPATRREADPLSLARERTKTFAANRKIFYTSTPTLKTGHIWRAMEDADEVRHYFVPCPHCGEMIELLWKQVKFPDNPELAPADRAEYAWYKCQECGGVITDSHKREMLRLGRWRAVERRRQNPRRVAFWINTLYSPFVRFSECVLEWLRSQHDTEKLQNFINSWLAEPWEDTKTTASAAAVLDRANYLPRGTVPDWAQLVTAGVDVQRKSLYWSIDAWSAGMVRRHHVDHGHVLTWEAVAAAMNQTYPIENSKETALVNLCLVDCSDGETMDEALDFCVRNAEWAAPCKGSAATLLQHYRISQINRPGSSGHGLQMVLIDTGKYKDQFAAQLKADPGYGLSVFAGCDEEWARQVTAEHKVAERAGGRDVLRWKPKSQHGDNHYLDCSVYAAAGADALGVRYLAEEAEAPEGAGSADKAKDAWVKVDGVWV